MGTFPPLRGLNTWAPVFKNIFATLNPTSRFDFELGKFWKDWGSFDGLPDRALGFLPLALAPLSLAEYPDDEITNLRARLCWFSMDANRSATTTCFPFL